MEVVLNEFLTTMFDVPGYVLFVSEWIGITLTLVGIMLNSGKFVFANEKEATNRYRQEIKDKFSDKDAGLVKNWPNFDVTEEVYSAKFKAAQKNYHELRTKRKILALRFKLAGLPFIVVPIAFVLLNL